MPAHLPLAGKWCSPWAIEEDDGLEAGCRGGAAVLAVGRAEEVASLAVGEWLAEGAAVAMET